MKTPCNPVAVAWDGTDRWPIGSSSLIAMGGAGGAGGGGGSGAPGGAGGCDASAPGYDVDSPAFVSSTGYVADGVLVANLPEAGIILGVDDDVAIRLRLVGGFVAGTY